MRHVRDSIWNVEQTWIKNRHSYAIVIPVNIGWKRSGENVMGAGLAKEALGRWPGIDAWLGAAQKWVWEEILRTKKDADQHCLYREFIIKHPTLPLIFFPTKELNRDFPYSSWRNKSREEYILPMLEFLKEMADEFKLERVAVPLLGAGNGGLDPQRMRDAIKEKLKDSGNNLVLVTPVWI